jgi:hypothetical protein
MKITDIDKEIKKKIVADRQKEYGDYQYNFTILAELFTLILAPNLKKKIKAIPSGSTNDDSQIIQEYQGL